MEKDKLFCKNLKEKSEVYLHEEIGRKRKEMLSFICK